MSLHFAAEIAGFQSISRRRSPVFFTWASMTVRPHACHWEKAMFPRVSNRVVASAASLAGVAGRRRWPASLASRRRSRTKRTESSTKPIKTFHSPVHRKQRATHHEPRRHARDIQRLVEPLAITHRARANKTRPTKRPGHEKRGATRRRSCANRHTQTGPTTDEQMRKTTEIISIPAALGFAGSLRRSAHVGERVSAPTSGAALRPRSGT